MTSLFFRAAAAACLLATPLGHASASLVLSANEDQSIYRFGTPSSLVSLESLGKHFGRVGDPFTSQGGVVGGGNAVGDDDADEARTAMILVSSLLSNLDPRSRANDREGRTIPISSPSKIAALFGLDHVPSGRIAPTAQALASFEPNRDVMLKGAFLASACPGESCFGEDVFAFSDSRPGSVGRAIAYDARQQAALKSTMAAANAAVSSGASGGVVAPALADASVAEGVALIEEIGVTTSPEPASVILVGIGLTALAGFARRRRRP
jgi:hypothetical protein